MRWREEPPAEPSISSVLNLRDLQEYVSNWRIASLPEYKARNIFRRNWHLFLTLLQSMFTSMEQCSQMIKSHPSMVLISENPVTWKGFLIVDTNLGYAIDVTLIVPYYPRLTELKLLFGQSISLLHGTNFSEKIVEILKYATTLPSLLFQLKRIIMNLLKEKFDGCNAEVPNLREDIVKEIEAALRLDSPIEISANKGLTAVKLSLEDVCVIMRKDIGANVWKVMSSDLPQLPGVETFASNVASLSCAMAKLQMQVEMLRDAWGQLREIDDTCWVVDPPEPKPYHLYRRINLTSSVSALIIIDPMNVCELPNIKLLGSSSEVAKYRNIMSSNLLKWDPESSITDNLRILMAIDDLPQRPEGERGNGERAIVEDDECCICFAMELDDQQPAVLPVEICNNDKCRKRFHTFCLRQWLQSIAANQVAFDQIHGKCPNCSENISCSLLPG